MATSDSLLLKKMSGHIGRELVIKQYGDKTVISKFPVFRKNRKFSMLQLMAQEAMSEANIHARSIIRDTRLRVEAQARLNVTRNKLYTALIREYFENKRKGETSSEK
jgi:hypothetical protein